MIGGLRRIEGAFVGALAYVYINDRLAATDFSIGGHKLGTFNSLIGLIFLAIVLVSPDGLLGLWEPALACAPAAALPAPRRRRRLTRHFPRRPIDQASCPPIQRRTRT